MGLRFNPRPVPRFDQSLLPVLNENFQNLARLLAQVPSESVGTIPPDSPYIGQPWFDTADGIQKWWDGTDWTPDKPWIPYSPVVTQGVTLTRNLTYCGYDKLSRTVNFQGLIGITSNGTAGQPILCTLPFSSPVAANRAIGSGYYYTGAANVPGLIAYMVGASTIGFLKTNGAALGSGETAVNTAALTFDVKFEATT